MRVGAKLARMSGRVKQIGGHRNWENYRDLLFVLVQKELKVRYNNKLLGYLWSIANPLAHALVYYIAFRIFMRVHVPNYVLVLISGLFPWQWFTNAVGASPNLFIGNSSIIKKISFPRSIVPLCAVLNHTIHFIASMPVIVLFLLIYRQTPSVSWLYGFPILLIIQFLMVYGISLALASINVFFRDLERLVNIIMHFVFYVTPILYPLDQIPTGYQKLIFINPAAPLVISWRELILNGTLEPLYLLISFGYALLFFAIGYFIYQKLTWKFAEVI